MPSHPATPTDSSPPRPAAHWAGWLPVVILPLAAADQLFTAVSAEDVSGISMTAWALFFLANVGSLAFARAQTPLAKLQVWVAFGTTALIDVGIVLVLLLRAGT